MVGTFWALVPPILAIVLALITKEAYSSLFIGVVVGALFVSGGSVVGALNALILILLDDIPPSCFGKEGASLPDPRIQKALNIITEAFRKRPTPKLDNGQLSRALGMSEVNFIHLFKREMKMPPQRYIMHKRLDFARDLLHNNTISIEHISYITGFADRYHFTRAFSRCYGFSPGACRKKMQSAGK